MNHDEYITERSIPDLPISPQQFSILALRQKSPLALQPSVGTKTRIHEVDFGKALLNLSRFLFAASLCFLKAVFLLAVTWPSANRSWDSDCPVYTSRAEYS